MLKPFYDVDLAGDESAWYSIHIMQRTLASCFALVQAGARRPFSGGDGRNKSLLNASRPRLLGLISSDVTMIRAHLSIFAK